jgi:hypothetical protein
LNGAIVQGEKDAVLKFLETKKPSTKKLNAGLHRAAAAGQADILGLPPSVVLSVVFVLFNYLLFIYYLF